jgi:hypothetical protein
MKKDNEKGIFAVGATSDEGVILRSQGDGNWKREDIKSKDVRRLSGIWGNNEKGIFAVGDIKPGELEYVTRGVILKRNKDKNWEIYYSAKIHWEKFDFEAKVEINYGVLSFFLVAFITLAVFGYTLLPVKKLEKIQLPDKKQESIIQQLKTDITGADILLETIRETKEKMESMLKRSSVILAFGIGMALLGGFLFYLILEASFDKFVSMGKKPETWELIFSALRATGILLLVESITYFFLRQYRALLSDYKYFFNIYTKRSDYAAAIRLLSNKNISDNDRKILIEKLLTEKTEQSSTSSPELDGPTLQKIVLELIKKIGK